MGDRLTDIIDLSLDLIEADVRSIAEWPRKGGNLDSIQASRLANYLKVLVPVARDRREAKELKDEDVKQLTDDELAKAVLDEAEKMRAKVKR